MNGTIIIFAAIAIFLGLRLYSVLGKKTGHQQSFTPVERTEPVAPIPVATPENVGPRPVAYDFDIAPSAQQGLKAIAAADRSFDLPRFVSGAKSAYRVILEAYWKGDWTTIRPLVDDDVFDAFKEAFDLREIVGETLDNRLITIENILISNAELVNGQAEVTLRFDADIAAVTRDKDDRVVAGSLSDAVPTHDVWSFARLIGSPNPNWVLVDTDEAS